MKQAKPARASVDPKHILKPARVARCGGLDVRLCKGCTLLGVVAKGVGTRRIITQSLALVAVNALFPCMPYRMQWPILGE